MARPRFSGGNHALTNGTPIANAKSVADLKPYQLGAQIGTTSLGYINDTIQPDKDPRVYDTSNDVIAAINAKQIDGLVVDLPTAFFLVGAEEVKNGKVQGQFPSTGSQEHFGMLFQEGNTLRDCVNEALAAKWQAIRSARRVVTGALEKQRTAKVIGASLEAAPVVYVTEALAQALSDVAFDDLAPVELDVVADFPALAAGHARTLGHVAEVQLTQVVGVAVDDAALSAEVAARVEHQAAIVAATAAPAAAVRGVGVAHPPAAERAAEQGADHQPGEQPAAEAAEQAARERGVHRARAPVGHAPPADEHLARLRVGREEHLEAPVQQEAVHRVGAHPAAHRVTRLQHPDAHLGLAQHPRAREPREPREPRHLHPKDGPVITSFTFRVRNRPAALYKALGGFATSDVNMIKLESYVDGAFTQAEFYAEIVGHPQEERVRLAFEELRFFSHQVDILGVYPPDRFRERIG